MLTMKKVILLSLVGLVIAMGLLYMEFKNSPVTKMDVRDGVVIGEMGFLEARSAALTCICVTWLVVLLAAFLKINAAGKKTRVVQQETKPEGQ
jgi:hypothetical protein